jgi:hypothetical protein
MACGSAAEAPHLRTPRSLRRSLDSSTRSRNCGKRDFARNPDGARGLLRAPRASHTVRGPVYRLQLRAERGRSSGRSGEGGGFSGMRLPPMSWLP